VTDAQLIAYCAAQVSKPHSKYTGWTVRRMCALARVAPPETMADGEVLYCVDLITLLVRRAQRIQAVPAGGHTIRVGRAFRGIDGDIRRVVSLPPHDRQGGVRYQTEPDGAQGYSRLPEFKVWAIERVTP
jgi:hypothetical protein